MPKYINKEIEIQNFLDNLYKGFNGKGYNFEVLNKYNLIKDYDKYVSFKQEQQNSIEEFKSKYKELYLSHITEKIDEFYKNRIKLSKELKQISFQLKTNPDNSKELRKNMLILFHNNNKLF